jgi:lipopolysaccharide export system permease protein
MTLVKKQILTSLKESFFSIFIPIFIISTLVSLAQISSLTSVISINFTELMMLYAISLPSVLLYILPLSFFIGATIAISKLSGEYELLVLFALKLNPLNIAKILLPMALYISMISIFISIVLVPKAHYIKKQFISMKKQDAQLNLQANQYSQKLGDWFVFIEKKELINDKVRYKNLVLFKSDNDTNSLITADEAYMQKTKHALLFHLISGKTTINSNDTINQINFEKMTIQNNLPSFRNISSLTDVVEYWQDKIKDSGKMYLLDIVLVGLLPLCSLVLYLVIGIYNPRHNKNHSVALSILGVVIYIIIIKNYFVPDDKYIQGMLFPFAWLFISYIFYRIKIKDTY